MSLNFFILIDVPIKYKERRVIMENKWKVLIAVGIAGVLGFVVFFGYTLLVKGTNSDYYYTKIATEGTRITDKDTEGVEHIDYTYKLSGFNEKGKKVELSFRGNKEVPLKKDAYLKVSYSPGKGVTSWEEVKKSQVPKKALAGLEKTYGLFQQPLLSASKETGYNRVERAYSY